jgi:fatty acid-binding protein DegV
MDKNKTLDIIKQSAFFKSLTLASQEELERKWAQLSEEQVQKVLFLAINEKITASYLADLGSSMIQSAKIQASKKLVKKLEETNAGQEEILLKKLLSDQNGN